MIFQFSINEWDQEKKEPQFSSQLTDQLYRDIKQPVDVIYYQKEDHLSPCDHR